MTKPDEECKERLVMRIIVDFDAVDRHYKFTTTG